MTPIANQKTRASVWIDVDGTHIRDRERERVCVFERARERERVCVCA